MSHLDKRQLLCGKGEDEMIVLLSIRTENLHSHRKKHSALWWTVKKSCRRHDNIQKMFQKSLSSVCWNSTNTVATRDIRVQIYPNYDQDQNKLVRHVSNCDQSMRFIRSRNVTFIDTETFYKSMQFCNVSRKTAIAMNISIWYKKKERKEKNRVKGTSRV